MKRSFQNHYTLSIFLLLSIAIAVGFFLPVSRESWLGYAFKIVLLFAIFFALYFLVMANLQDKRKSLKGNSETDQEPIELPDNAQTETWNGFGAAFQWIKEEFLSIVRDSLVASCAGFYLEKGDQGLEFQGGENEQGHIERSYLLPEGSILEMVVREKQPLLQGNLPIGVALPGIPDPEIRSLIGAPMIVNNEVVGVLAAGSETTDHFSEEDKNFLVRCAELITKVMSVCHRGLRWEADHEIYRVHLALEKVLKNVQDEDIALSHFVQQLKRLFPMERFTFCVRSGEEAQILHVYGQIDDMDKGVRFPLEGGLNGWVIRRNTSLIIKDMEEGDYIRPRYLREENVRHGLRSYMGVPLAHMGEEAWGCISLESKTIDQYQEKGKEALMDLAIVLQNTLNRIRMEKQLETLTGESNAARNKLKME